MTIQQKTCSLIMNMPDERAALIYQLINNMTSVFLTGKEEQKTVREITADTSRRFGTGIGTITDTSNFDKWDDEIADMFEENRL